MAVDGVRFPHIGSTARFSLDGVYRYELTRRWARGPVACWIMLNPSTADAVQDDATIRRCIRFSRDWGMSGLVVVNLFAFRATKPTALFDSSDPIGDLNDEAIHDAVVGSRITILAWGAHGGIQNRDVDVLGALQVFRPEVYCLAYTKDGHPGHPLRLPCTSKPYRYERGT